MSYYDILHNYGHKDSKKSELCKFIRKFGLHISKINCNFASEFEKQFKNHETYQYNPLRYAVIYYYSLRTKKCQITNDKSQICSCVLLPCR